MPTKYSSSVKLRKANRYFTYQFYAEMANKNIDPKDGLKIAALTCLSWLRDRLEGNDIDKNLKLPTEDNYKKVSDDKFRSFTIKDSYLISVESDLKEGIWALNINENDSGTISGEIVPGRTIQSDIGFRIIDNKLACAFKTTVNDLNDVEKANCIRYSLIKDLGCNPNFGFIQVNELYNPNNMIIDDESKLNEVLNVLHSRSNQLPLIIYTYDDHSLVDVSDIKLEDFKENYTSLGNNTKSILNKAIQDNKEPEDDFTLRNKAYANRYLGYARAYFLSKKMFKSFKNLFNVKEVSVNSVFVVDAYNYQTKRYDYEDKDKYQKYIFNYTRDKVLDFHDVLFVTDARILIQRNNENAIQEIEKQLLEEQNKFEQFKSKQERSTRKNDYVFKDNSKDELIDTLKRLESTEKEKQVLNNEIDRLKREILNKNEYIDYLHRKDDRPKYHKDIYTWALQFSYIVLDKKAKDCLDKKDAENVDIDVICDALDYLDKAYSKYLFENITIDELNDISDRIYGRPYNVSPSGIPSSAKSDCKIRYTFNNEKRKEYVLDQHLKIGRHGELLRIYFIVDKDRKKIVIGSLPNHLEY